VRAQRSGNLSIRYGRFPVPDQLDPPRKTLLCISQSFAPATKPTAIRAAKLLERLNWDWDVEVITETAGPDMRAGVRVHTVPGRRPRRLLSALRRARLDKLLEMTLWPDDSIFWVVPAILAGRRLARERSPSALVVFMMPYSAGLVGLVLGRLCRLPLILNLDDSPTCTDMHPSFPTRLHYLLAKALEDAYARRADAIVYVSQTNLDAVRERAPRELHAKFHLVRYGGDRPEPPPPTDTTDGFVIAYLGAMSGWWALIGEGEPGGRLKRAYRAWTELGRYQRVALDDRTSSPAVIGRAIVELSSEHPDWKGRLKLAIHGNPYASEVVARALDAAGVQDVVEVEGPLPHDRVAPLLANADLLFLTLPGRPDGSRGGRISAKTYEYLTTDRPILAAVPPGENWDYLADKPGVWLVAPDDHEQIKNVLVELAAAKFEGRPRTFDRAAVRSEISYDARAAQFAEAISAGIERAGSNVDRPAVTGPRGPAGEPPAS
jgi:Glycosyl transferase 4-like domain